MSNDKRRWIEGIVFPGRLRPDHSGGELDDRQYRHVLRAEWPVPYSRRTAPHGAVGRADDRIASCCATWCSGAWASPIPPVPW